jgi:hypothetical protein
MPMHKLEIFTQQEMKLAREIARTLDDMDSLPMHLILVRRHTETFLREKLNFVMSKPDSQIDKSRAAYYIFLVNHSKYGNARH